MEKERSDADRKVCCMFTGHRSLPGDRESVERLRRKVCEAVRRAYAQGCRVFYAGGAIGFDMLASEETLRLRDAELHDLRLILAVPFFGHYRGWPHGDRAAYVQVLSRADGAVYIAGEYERGCMQKRNRYMVDRASRCICYLTKRRGGTAYTVAYAEAEGLTVDNLAEQTEAELQISLFDEKNT